MGSVWKNTATLPSFGQLEGDLRTDVLIIGGGMAGILTAYMLDRAGVDYALVTAGCICGGVTANTTAKLTIQHGLIYDKLIREFGEEKARLYLEANEAALSRYRALCADIECDFADKDSYVYSLADKYKIESELEALARLKYPAELAQSLPLPFPVAGAVRFRAQAQFHPLKFVSAIARGLNIFENTEVRRLAPYRAVTARGTVSAQEIIAATHFPFLNKHGSYFLKLYQERSYVLALERAPAVNGMYVDAAKEGLSFRNHDGLLLLGGASSRTGKKSDGWHGLERFAARCYPASRIKYRWAAQDCISLDGAPYIGPYSKHTRGLYVATGFNKWGMTSSMLSAMLLTDMVMGRENPYAGVFSPSRTVLRPQLLINGAEAVMNLLTPTLRRCPHLGCALKWNRIEHTWDCSCHGSRFGEDGHLINNPATGGLMINTGRNGR